MTSREIILAKIRKNQPHANALPDLKFPSENAGLLEQFATVLVSIGGAIIKTRSWKEIENHILGAFPKKRIVTTIPDLKAFKLMDLNQTPHTLEDVTLAILPGKFGVAENGAVWVADSQMGDRALPFITEHLALVIDSQHIVASMHEAYGRIGDENYSYGTFIAGPSKTADIEQSLVLGAHGAKTLTVYLIAGD
jgi:L-lactate dehydrogenase complex protein LldG